MWWRVEAGSLNASATHPIPRSSLLGKVCAQRKVASFDSIGVPEASKMASEACSASIRLGSDDMRG